MPTKYLYPIALLAATLLAGSAFAAEPPEHHPHHHAFAQDVDAFHAALAPLWHARPGKERTRNACAKAADLETLAGNIRSADAKPLLGSIAAFKKQCQTSPGKVDAAFSDVHDAFHHLIEPAGR